MCKDKNDSNNSEGSTCTYQYKRNTCDKIIQLNVSKIVTKGSMMWNVLFDCTHFYPRFSIVRTFSQIAVVLEVNFAQYSRDTMVVKYANQSIPF